MQTEYVPRVGRISRERLVEAIEAADAVFWETLASQLPELTSGDINPIWLTGWENARNDYALSFVSINHDSNLSYVEAEAIGLDPDVEWCEYLLDEDNARALLKWREENCV